MPKCNVTLAKIIAALHLAVEEIDEATRYLEDLRRGKGEEALQLEPPPEPQDPRD